MAQSNFLDEAGKPTVDAASSFLTGNPLTSAAITQIADDPNVKGVFAAIKGVTDVISPMEHALLVRYSQHSVFLAGAVSRFCQFCAAHDSLGSHLLSSAPCANHIEVLSCNKGVSG